MRISLRFGSIFNRSQRYSRGITRQAVEPGHFVPGCVAAQAASNPFHGRELAASGGTFETATRIFHPYLPRSPARRDECVVAGKRAALIRRYEAGVRDLT